ncbi:phage holin family protein [Xylanibacter muris]|uniref:Phage holin family protein n=2 Tax=Xylanibacter muris TaxID=2736290 RepID=A0ABX2AJK6_9BACT|nr:phage holin family protein [Xylanibacter muris]NPD91339.1 phage holin family protein [Xylanibacter muris]
MLSSDKNVELIAQLIETLRSYLKTQKEYIKFDVTEKTVRLLTAMALAVTMLILVIAVLFYFSFAFIYMLEPHLGTAGSFAAVGGFFLLMLILVILFRKSWIERPIIKILANILLNK